MAKSIVLFPNEVLSVPCRALTGEELANWTYDTKSLSLLAEDMRKVMKDKDGVGLAAPQVGVPIRFFIASIDNSVIEIANPVLTFGEDRIDMIEGCLSIPGIHAFVNRPKTITIEGYSKKGPIRMDLSGMNARVCQHEQDHLDGILFIQRVSEANRTRILNHIKRLHDEYQHI